MDKISTSARVSAALSDARDLTYRVQALVDRLCGAVMAPTPATGANISTGVLPDLADSSDRTALAVKDAFDALNRLEAHFN